MNPLTRADGDIGAAMAGFRSKALRAEGPKKNPRRLVPPGAHPDWQRDLLPLANAHPLREGRASGGGPIVMSVGAFGVNRVRGV